MWTRRRNLQSVSTCHACIAFNVQEAVEQATRDAATQEAAAAQALATHSSVELPDAELATVAQVSAGQAASGQTAWSQVGPGPAAGEQVDAAHATAEHAGRTPLGAQPGHVAPTAADDPLVAPSQQSASVTAAGAGIHATSGNAAHDAAALGTALAAAAVPDVAVPGPPQQREHDARPTKSIKTVFTGHEPRRHSAPEVMDCHTTNWDDCNSDMLSSPDPPCYQSFTAEPLLTYWY